MKWNEVLDEITENDRSSMYIHRYPMCFKWKTTSSDTIHFNQLGRFLFFAEAIYSILKRMHRAARIPDDDAEALQIGARRQWYRWKGSH